MALTDSQKTSKLFKLAMGASETSIIRQFYEEPFSSSYPVLSIQVWQEADLIPTTAPGGIDGEKIGVVTRYIDKVLNQVAGAVNAWYHDDLKDTIPFNFGDGTYNYVIKDNLNNDIPFGLNDWLLDPVAGVLYFYGGNPPNPPFKISFYKYSGLKGVGGSISGNTSLEDAIIAETSNRIVYDQSLENIVSIETSNRIAYDQSLENAIQNIDYTSLENSISIETSNRLVYDQSLEDEIISETSNRIIYDQSLEDQIIAEISNRIVYDQSLESLISIESSIRFYQDNSLENLISIESSTRLSMDNSLEYAIQNIDYTSLENLILTESSIRTLMDESLESAILLLNSSLEVALITETNLRISSDESLESILSVETSNRIAYDQSLENLIINNTNYLQVELDGKKQFHGFVNRTDSYLSINTPSNGYVSISGITYVLYHKGVEFVLGGEYSIEIPTGQTMYYVFFRLIDNNLVIDKTLFEWNPLSEHILIGRAFNDDGLILFEDMRHHYDVNYQVINWTKKGNISARYSSGLNGNFDELDSFSISQGVILNNDIVIDTLSTITSCMVWMKDTNPSLMQLIDDNYTRPNYFSGGELQYDNDGVLTSLTGETDMAIYWIYATGDINQKISMVLGNKVYISLEDAKSENQPDLTFYTKPYWKSLYKLIYSRASGGGIEKLEDVQDYRYIHEGIPAAVTSNSHTGLMDRELPNAHPAEAIAVDTAGYNILTNIFEQDTMNREIDSVLNKLLPAKPQNLSNITLGIVGSYSASESSTGTIHSVCTDNTNPDTTTASQFWDGDEGTLTIEYDSVADGEKVLTTSDDSGIYDSLRITTDVDYYSGQTGKEGFWTALTTFGRRVSALSVSGHTVQLKHTKTGDTNLLTFYVDDPITPSAIGSINSFPSVTRYVSGVPSLAFGQNISVDLQVSNAVRTHYHSTRTARVQGTQITAQNYNGTIDTVSGTIPNSGDTLYYSGKNVPVLNSVYIENIQLSFIGYNSKNTASTTYNLSTGTRIDTISNESNRLVSGSGQYPSSGYGGVYNSSTSLLTYTDEIQMLNSRYRYPIGNYSGNTQGAGPDYSSISEAWRYVVFQPVSLTSRLAFTITFNGILGTWTGSGAATTGLRIYARVDGSTPTNGWVDANAPYSLGNPTNDGDPAMVTGSSTFTVKRVTFGTATKTGNLYIRIGIPSGSDKQFQSITISSIS